MKAAGRENLGGKIQTGDTSLGSVRTLHIFTRRSSLLTYLSLQPSHISVQAATSKKKYEESLLEEECGGSTCRGNQGEKINIQ